MAIQRSDEAVEAEVEKLQKRALEIFQQGAAESYINTPAWLSYDRLTFRGDRSAEPPIDIEPLSFFSPSVHPDRLWRPSPATASPPFLSIVTGPYGIGKTELARQICNNAELRPLPVMLLRCGVTECLHGERPTKSQLMRLLFGQFFEGGSLPADLEAKLLRSLQSGQFLLILDGLDELIFDVDEHYNFFRALAEMLFDIESWHVGFRVIVTVRREYLRAFDTTNATELVKNFHKGASVNRPFSLSFLRLDYMKRTQVSDMLRERLGEYAAHVEQHDKLLQILDRPLLARIFCDYAEQQILEESSADPQFGLVQMLDRIRDGVDVIERYIISVLSHASEDHVLSDRQRLISTGFAWDLDALARKALELYQSPQRSSLTIDDIRDCSVAPSGDTAADAESAWRAVHKCPFLEREDQSTVRFSHPIYYVFLVAKGLQLDSDNLNGDGFALLDELVLDVDVRRYVRAMMGDGWYPRTQRSYSLLEEQLSDWDSEYGLTRLNANTRKELESERRALLDLMTEPERVDPDEAIEVVGRFLNRKLRHLHPRYLMHNLEAVNVFIKSFHWHRECRDLGEAFPAQLEKLIKELDEALPLPADSPRRARLQAAYELLITHLLQIGRRMRAPWYRKYKKMWTDHEKFKSDIGGDRSDLEDDLDAIFADSWWEEE